MSLALFFAKSRQLRRGQALVEFALVSVVLMLLLGAVVEFGFLFSHKLELTNAARSGARWASLHSTTAWSANASPDSNTIEGQVRAAGGTSTLPNDDAHITIEYFNITGATQTLCGHYSAALPGFVAAAGYSQATCVIPGNLVRVTLTNSYSLVTGLLGRGVGTAVTTKAVAAMPVIA
jgi:Flp pilus assembly protein TadG